MKKFLFKLLLYISIIVVLDFAIGNFLEVAYFNQKKGKFYRITNILENIESDVLIFGSSRAVQHYDPSIFEKKLGLTTFNAGLDGQSIIYHKLVLEIMLSRYKPKMVILDLFEVMDFPVNNKPYDRLSVLLPYIERYPSIKPVIQRRSYFEKLKLYSKIYPYNSLFFRIVEGNMGLFKTDASNTGYIPKNGTWNQPIEKINYSSPVYDEKKVAYFYQFVELCKKNDVPLFVIISPKYQDCENCFAFSRKICEKAGVELHDYSSENTFLSNVKYFENPSHLNLEGSQLYSKFVVAEIMDNYADFQSNNPSIASGKSFNKITGNSENVRND